MACAAASSWTSACRSAALGGHLLRGLALLAAACTAQEGLHIPKDVKLPFGISEAVPEEEAAEPKYPQGLLTVPRGGEEEVTRFVEAHMEPRHAVAVGVAGKGTKRHQLLEELAADENLNPVLAFAVQFAKGKSSLTVFLHRYAPVPYEGKWTRTALRAWLLHTAYPLVNRVQEQFAPPKYLIDTLFGAVLIVKPLAEQSDELVRALEPHAERLRHRLKFSFFVKSSDPDTQKLCEIFGIWSSDELLVLEKPSEQKLRLHTHVPSGLKYRLEGVTPERIDHFFKGYEAGSWPRYFVSTQARSDPVFRDGVRELTSWDFMETVANASLSVLVAFVSKDCKACEEFSTNYVKVARRLEDARRQSNDAFAHLLLARMDQTANEHSETIRGTPALRYWRSGSHKRPADVDPMSADAIWDFLEERAAEEAQSASMDAEL